MDGKMLGGKWVKKGVGKCYIFNCHGFVTRSLYNVGVYFVPCATAVFPKGKPT